MLDDVGFQHDFFPCRCIYRFLSESLLNKQIDTLSDAYSQFTYFIITTTISNRCSLSYLLPMLVFWQRNYPTIVFKGFMGSWYGFSTLSFIPSVFWLVTVLCVLTPPSLRLHPTFAESPHIAFWGQVFAEWPHLCDTTPPCYKASGFFVSLSYSCSAKLYWWLIEKHLPVAYLLRFLSL